MSLFNKSRTQVGQKYAILKCSSFSIELEKGWESIYSILLKGEECLSQYYPSAKNVTLYLFGTGGMRLLSEKETMPLFNYLVREMKQTTLPFSLPIQNCQILSGSLFYIDFCLWSRRG